MFVGSVVVANVTWLGEFTLKGMNEERADGVDMFEGVKGNGVPGSVCILSSKKSDVTLGSRVV
jgi:hypothetical protein